MLPSLTIPAAVNTGAMYRWPQLLVALCGLPRPLQKKYSPSVGSAKRSSATLAGIGTDTGVPVFARFVVTR